MFLTLFATSTIVLPEGANRRSFPDTLSGEPVVDFTRTACRNHPLRVPICGGHPDVGTITHDVIVVWKEPTRRLLTGFNEEDVPGFQCNHHSESRSSTIEGEVGPHHVRSYNDRRTPKR